MYKHVEDGTPRERIVEMYLERHKPVEGESRFENHCELRLAYERQMIEAAGGMAGEEEIAVGGRLDGLVVYKVNKSTATGRVTSVDLLRSKPDENGKWQFFPNYNLERKTGGTYTAPKPEDIELVKQVKAEIKAASTKKTIPLINPTVEDAKKLQALFNADHAKGRSEWGHKDAEIYEMTQAIYSNNSGGSYSPCETVYLGEGGKRPWRQYYGYTKEGVCRARMYTRTGGESAPRVIVITDAPQKALPASVLVTVAEGVTV